MTLNSLNPAAGVRMKHICYRRHTSVETREIGTLELNLKLKDERLLAMS